MDQNGVTGQLVLAVAGGSRMQPELRSGIVQRTLVWLAQAARVYDTDGIVEIIGYGTHALNSGTLSLGDSLAILGFAEKPITDVGTGANMAPAIEMALGLPNDGHRRVIVLTGDCHIDDADAAERLIATAPEGTLFVMLRVATSLEGLDTARKLFEGKQKCVLIHGTDSTGRIVADLERCFNRFVLPAMRLNVPV